MSAFKTIFRIVWLPNSDSNNISKLEIWFLANRSSLAFSALSLEISLAIFSLVTTTNSSPALGGTSSPVIDAGTEGPASDKVFPFSSTRLLTLFVCSPTRIISPFLRVPFCTRIVATAPFPTSVVESNTTPKAGPL